jgi:hypothetical protein
MSVLSAFPTLSSSTPLSDWFANVNHLCNMVNSQGRIIQNLQERIAVLESQARIIPVRPTEESSVPESTTKKRSTDAPKRKVKAAKVAKAAKEENVANDATVSSGIVVSEKKRGRKPADANLSAFLREGEQIIARIPLGDRRFDEHAAIFQEGKLHLEDGQTFDHPTTLCAALAKMLEDIGERSSECSKSMNGWILCTAGRDGKRVALEKLKPADVSEASETAVVNATE